MLDKIEKPEIEIVKLKPDGKYGMFVLEPLEAGYGNTLGNSLRRVLLSSLPGVAVTAVKIDGVQHEFSTIPGVKEDVTEIILNVKGLIAKMYGDAPKNVCIKAEGECEVTAGDIKADSDVASLEDLADKHVMTQTDSAGLEVLSEDEFADVVKTFAGGAPETLGDYNNIMMQLESGAVDAVVCDLSIAARQMAAKPDVFKQVQTLSDEEYAVGFKKGNTEMVDAVNATLKEMTADGTVEKILKNYEDQAVSMDNWLIK